jgi:hypothetical protein
VLKRVGLKPDALHVMCDVRRAWAAIRGYAVGCGAVTETLAAGK